MTRKPSKELRDLYSTYLKKRLRPENALEFATNFILDLINAFGDKVNPNEQIDPTSKEFAPQPFLLQLNQLLAKYKQTGPKSLDDIENTLLHDTHLLVATLITSSLTATTPSGEEKLKLPIETAEDLRWLVDNAS